MRLFEAATARLWCALALAGACVVPTAGAGDAVEARVKTDRVNLRARAEATSEVVGQVSVDERLPVQQVQEEWVQVVPPDRIDLWVHRDFVKDNASTVDRLNIRAGAGINYSVVGTLEAVSTTFGLSEFFVGIILVPIIGNVAEHLVAVQVAMKDQMDLSLSIALGSSLQIALFVAPLLVFVSLFLGNPMTLEFNHPEILAMVAASIIAALVAIDARSNWLEGAMLLAVYLILGIGFFFLPAII